MLSIPAITLDAGLSSTSTSSSLRATQAAKVQPTSTSNASASLTSSSSSSRTTSAPILAATQVVPFVNQIAQSGTVGFASSTSGSAAQPVPSSFTSAGQNSVDATKTLTSGVANKSDSTALIAGSSAGGAALLIAIGLLAYFLYRRRAKQNRSLDADMMCRGDSIHSAGIADIKADDAIYGGVTRKTSRSGKVLNIKRLLLRTDRDQETPKPSRKISRQILGEPPGRDSQFIRSYVSNSFARPLDAHRETQFVGTNACSSFYSTDVDLPFQLGSPRRISPAATHDMMPRHSLRPTYGVYSQPSNGNTLPSRFSDADSIAMASSGVHSYKESESNIIDGYMTRSPDPPPKDSKYMNFSRPVPPVPEDDNATDLRARMKQDIQERFNADRINLDAIDEEPFLVVDGRRTQVYKLLKRALGR